MLKKTKLSFVISKVQSPPEVAQLIQKRLGSFKVFAVYGGDGAITVAIKSLADIRAKLLILPGGTNNVIAKEHNIPQDFLEVMQMYIDGRFTTSSYDLSSVGGEKLSLSMHTGWWAEATKSTPREHKKRWGVIAYGISAIKTLKKSKKRLYQFTIDGKTYKKYGYTLLLANRGAQVFMGLKLFPNKHRAGVLRIALIQNPSFFQFGIWIIGRTFSNNNLGNLVKTYKGHEVVVKKSSKQFIYDDTEVVLPLPLKITGAQHETKLLVPAASVSTSVFNKVYIVIQLIFMRVKERTRNLLSGTPNYSLSQVAPHVYLGGQYRKNAYKLFKSWGVTGIISMRSSTPKQISDEFEILHLKTRDWTPPELEDLKRGVEFASSKVLKGESVYIHCRQGEGRGPTMAAAYLINLGLSVEEALAQISKSRPSARPNRSQVKRLSEWQDSITDKT